MDGCESRIRGDESGIRWVRREDLCAASAKSEHCLTPHAFELHYKTCTFVGSGRPPPVAGLAWLFAYESKASPIRTMPCRGGGGPAEAGGPAYLLTRTCRVQWRPLEVFLWAASRSASVSFTAFSALRRGSSVTVLRSLEQHSWFVCLVVPLVAGLFLCSVRRQFFRSWGQRWLAAFWL
jgi:hypothetical protein